MTILRGMYLAGFYGHIYENKEEDVENIYQDRRIKLPFKEIKRFIEEVHIPHYKKLFINNPITVNGIQNEFGLGFNRTTYILDRLEKLEIISIKLGTKPREILITDKVKIKRRIEALKQE
ncbi:MAG: DNA translocase FtsK [Anaeroplasma sp.]|uniref:DNA translocase FtsK n=1 Tax=Anaeroplasma sp. TaxID=1872523 RepID=UPI002A918597|nr:DNA translocase FtsK [Anaeroplasma sp.]MDY5983742.1 DNA translocase FtsK [Anaeroplasma sp.]